MDLYGITVENYYAYLITVPYLHVQLSFTLRYLMRKCAGNNSLLNNSTWTNDRVQVTCVHTLHRHLKLLFRSLL